MFHSFWVGSQLSVLEITCLESHVSAGHELNLWCYQDLKNIPDGIVIRDASEIMPSKEIFSYRKGVGKGSLSACSNIFRYNCLRIFGGYWVDCDVYALKKFDFDDEYVFASEVNERGLLNAASCVIKCPKSSPLIEWCYQQAISQNKENLRWGQIGPKLLSKGIVKYHLQSFVKTRSTFCPLNWTDINQNIKNVSFDLHTNTVGIHLWQEMWRRNSIDKNECFLQTQIFKKIQAINQGNNES